MEEEDEQEEEVEVEVEQQPTSPSDLGGVPWKEAVQLHNKLRGEDGEGEVPADAVSRDGEIDEEEEEEEEDEEDEEEDEDEDDEESSEGKFGLCVFSFAVC